MAENEVFRFTTGEVNSFDCLDNWETVELNVEYSAILKTLDELDQKSFTSEFKIHLREWW